MVQAHEAANLMRQTLKEEHALKLDFISTVLKHVNFLPCILLLLYCADFKTEINPHPLQ